MELEQRPDDWSARPGTVGSADAPPSDLPSPAGEVADLPADAPGSPPRSARREATRQRVLDAAREVFAERGVIGATVEEICERAGFTRGAFYSNFTDKDDALDALIEREHGRLLAHLDASLAEVEGNLSDASDLPAVVAGLVDRIARTVPLDRQLSLVLTELEILAIRRPDQARRFATLNERFRDRIGAFIVEAMGHHGRELLVAPADFTDAVLAISERSARRAFLVRDGDPDALSSAVLPGVLLGLSRPIPPVR
jgi:AcrR family transcriptional regulator